jgi:anaerobic magnesium-protoporphyrin IX monomethyl ester cyclase
MKVLLAYLCHYQDRRDYFLSLMPVGLVSIAACLEKDGHDVTLANFSAAGIRKALKQIVDIKPRVIGLSLFTHNRVDTLKLVQEIRKALPAAVIMLGGPHATFLAGEIIRRYPEVDYIIQGEGEGPFAKLLKKIAEGKKPVGSVHLPLSGSARCATAVPAASSVKYNTSIINTAYSTSPSVMITLP